MVFGLRRSLRNLVLLLVYVWGDRIAQSSRLLVRGTLFIQVLQMFAMGLS